MYIKTAVCLISIIADSSKLLSNIINCDNNGKQSHSQISRNSIELSCDLDILKSPEMKSFPPVYWPPAALLPGHKRAVWHKGSSWTTV